MKPGNSSPTTLLLLLALSPGVARPAGADCGSAQEFDRVLAHLRTMNSEPCREIAGTNLDLARPPLRLLIEAMPPESAVRSGGISKEFPRLCLAVSDGIPALARELQSLQRQLCALHQRGLQACLRMPAGTLRYRCLSAATAQAASGKRELARRMRAASAFLVPLDSQYVKSQRLLRIRSEEARQRILRGRGAEPLPPQWRAELGRPLPDVQAFTRLAPGLDGRITGNLESTRLANRALLSAGADQEKIGAALEGSARDFGERELLAGSEPATGAAAGWPGGASVPGSPGAGPGGGRSSASSLRPAGAASPASSAALVARKTKNDGERGLPADRPPALPVAAPDPIRSAGSTETPEPSRSVSIPMQQGALMIRRKRGLYFSALQPGGREGGGRNASGTASGSFGAGGRGSERPLADESAADEGRDSGGEKAGFRAAFAVGLPGPAAGGGSASAGKEASGGPAGAAGPGSADGHALSVPPDATAEALLAGGKSAGEQYSLQALDEIFARTAGKELVPGALPSEQVQGLLGQVRPGRDVEQALQEILDGTAPGPANAGTREELAPLAEHARPAPREPFPHGETQGFGFSLDEESLFLRVHGAIARSGLE